MKTTLLVMACSATKVKVNIPTAAIDLYDGPSYKVLRGALMDARVRTGLTLLILSAKYGIVKPREPLPWYEQRMDKDRAKAIGRSVRALLFAQIEDHRPDRVVLFLGADYMAAVEPVQDWAKGVPVFRITGRIGECLQGLKRTLNREPTPFLVPVT